MDAPATKATGAVLLFGCVSAFLSLAFGTLDVSGKSFRAGGYIGEFLAHELSDYLNRTGSVIVILTLIFLAIIMSTQFSFGRLFSSIGGLLTGGVSRARRLVQRVARGAAARQAAARSHRQAHEEGRRRRPKSAASPAAASMSRAARKRDARDARRGDAGRGASALGGAIARACPAAEGRDALAAAPALRSGAGGESAGRAPQG